MTQKQRYDTYLDIKINLLIFSIIMALVGFFVGCRKETNGTGSGSRQDLIANAKKFFEKDVAPIALQNTQGIGGRTKKTPLWTTAQMINLSVGPAVVVSLKYEQNVSVTPSTSGGQPFSLGAMTKLLIYKGKDARNHALVITVLPDGGNNAQTNQYFSGMIISEDWAGNTVKDYRISSGNIYTRMKKAGSASPIRSKETQGKKEVTIITETCYFFTTCVGTVDNPYMSCSTADLGCTYDYGDGEDPFSAAPGDSGGGGGVSDPDIRNVVDYVDPNSFLGNTCSDTPQLTVSGTNTTATTINTGLFLLANVKITFDFDPRAQTLVPGSVNSHVTGFFAKTWTQNSITGIFTANGEINFIINATATTNLIPEVPLYTDYQIYVAYNVNTNTCYFSNYKL